MSEECVRVAVRIRPLLPKEVLHHHQVCVRVVPGSAQVMLGSDRLFSFDHAFGPTASQDEVYQTCVHPLVESLVDGYNATVFCYGQTGSGKTYTLGGGNQDEEGGIIDRVAQDVFLLLEKKQSSDGVEARLQVSYIELYREELRDLLELQMVQKELHIREDERGNTVVMGAREMVIASAEELLSVLEMGNALRHSGVTGMNDHSSRSHTILTLQVKFCCHNKNSSSKSVRSSKLCLVDLAGSERAGKTGNTGTRLKESAHINTGLLALGNVIRALSDHGRSRRGNSCTSAHIPYRDAKITRLLRDSLGGDAHTLMVACVSPSHHFVAETLNVLKFATKTRYIRNCPGKVCTQTDVKPDTWNPAEARLQELEYEVKTLRELLTEKEKDVEMERKRTGGRGGEGDGFKQPGQARGSEQGQKINLERAWQYCLLAQEAAALLADISGPSPSLLFKEQLQDWQERLTAVSQAQTDDIYCSEGCRDQPHQIMMLKLTKELHKYQDALCAKEQVVEQKDAEIKQKQKDTEKLLEEKRIQLLALEEEKERTRIQTEQLVNQQILIDRLQNNLITFHGRTSGAAAEARTSGYLNKRPHSVPLLRHSCVHRSSRKIHSSPPVYSLERVMAAFKMRGHLLLAKMEEKDEVYSPFIKYQTGSKETSQEKEEEEEEEEEEEMARTKFRRSLNRTWTSRQKKFPLKGKNLASHQIPEGIAEVQQSQGTTDTTENQPNRNQLKTVRRTSTAERRIHELTVNMRMKEELIKELDKTEKETQAVDRHGRHTESSGDVLVRLSMQSQQVRSEMYRSLQYMRLQRAELQSSLRQQNDSTYSNKSFLQNRGLRSENSAVSNSCHQEDTNKVLHDMSWLDEEEERVLQERAELRELEEEQKRREEVLQRREACLQQKNKLEVKRLRCSQVLSRDLLHVSVQLDSVQEQLQNSNGVRNVGGATREELDKERDMLKEKRDSLEEQLRDNRVLTAEEEHLLLQLDEAIEALDAALEFKNQAIENKTQQLLVSSSSLRQSQSIEPAQHYDIIRKLKKLSPPEALELLVKYFNKVVCLREVELRLRLRCEELELHVGEQEAVLREMEAAMQRLILDTDRRLTQQHRDHQNDIQLLLQKLKEGVSGEAQQAIQDRLQHLEKELFFYKSSSRQLKKKLKDLLGDALHPDNQPSHTQEHRKIHNMQMNANKCQNHSEVTTKATHITTTYTKIHTEQTDVKIHRESSDCHEIQKTKVSELKQMLTQSNGRSSRGQAGERFEATAVRLCHRDMRRVSPADPQVFSLATRRQQSAVDSSTESMIEDSIEVPRNTDR